MVMEESKLKELEEMDEEDCRKTESWLQENHEAWESTRIRKRADDMRNDLDKTGRQGKKTKNPRDSQTQKTSQGRPRKRLKYQLMEDDWGEASLIEKESEKSREHHDTRSIENTGDTVLELCSSNHPDHPTLQADQDSPVTLEEMQTAGEGLEMNLLHPGGTKIGRQEVHAGHEATKITNIGTGTKELIGDSPFDRKMMYAKEHGDDQQHKESISRDTYDAPVSPDKLLYHQEAVVEHPPLLPSVLSVATKCSEVSNNSVKTTFQEGLMEEHEPPTLPDIKEHQDEVRNIQEHRDKIRDGSSSYENFENSRLPPPTGSWKNHPLFTRRNSDMSSPTRSKKPTVRKKMNLLKKIENKQKIENRNQDIRKYCKTENDREDERDDENDCDMKHDDQVDECVHDVTPIGNISTVIIECNVQQPNIDRNIVPGVPSNDTTVHLYSEDRSVGSTGVVAGGGLATHVGYSQSDFKER